MMRGDEGAWREFHDRYYEDLRRVALSRGVSESEVADVIQRSYLRILKHMKPFSSEDDFRAWCCCLLRSEVIDTSRKNGRRLSMVERFKEWASVKSAQWVGADPLEGMAAADRSLIGLDVESLSLVPFRSRRNIKERSLSYLRSPSLCYSPRSL